ncbi:MAG: sulfatase [Pirellulales bacterium]
MTRYKFFLAIIAIGVFAVEVQAEATQKTVASQPPNIVIIFIDDMGYADVGPFGATAYKTPNIDRMAAEGRLFTDFHSATAVCSASRAALMTGCYPERVSISGALKPTGTHGINADEVTLAELCRSRGYATAIFGKWHLGHLRQFLPLQHGFDEYFGLPFSNNMWPYPPGYSDVKLAPVGLKNRHSTPLPLIQGNEIIKPALGAADQEQLTTWYTEHAVDFINRNKSRPFFLYVPHSMVHVPIFVSDKFRDKSGAGLYGDVVMEIDWSVGEILEALHRNGLDEQTLVIFTSDNGPALPYGNHAGSAAPLREGKGTMFEGGHREPCIMRWPGRIPAGTTCDELALTMDMLPTVAGLIGADVPNDRTIDGKDIWPLMAGEQGATSPHQVFYCYLDGNLRAVRDRRWKLFFPHKSDTLSGRPGGRDGVAASEDREKVGSWLFDLKNDVGEKTDVAAQHPDIVARLEKEAEKARAALGDSLTGRKGIGSEIRPAGHVDATKTDTTNPAN